MGSVGLMCMPPSEKTPALNQLLHHLPYYLATTLYVPAAAIYPSMPRPQMHRTSRLLIASTGVDSEWAHAKAATEANPAVAYLNADLWYRWCLLPEGHEFLYQTPALCSNASYSQANVPVTIVLSSKVRSCILSVKLDEDTFCCCSALYGLRR